MLRRAVQVRRDAAELVMVALLELAPTGFEEIDVDADTVEFAVYGRDNEVPSQAALEIAAADALVRISTSEIADDWADRWRDFHKPLVLGTQLSVRPPWEPEQETELDLVIDPGRAFGTGSHATTRLCLEALLDLEIPDGDRSVVDLGCGSGVLGIAAARLGWGPVLALDYDQLAVDATLENAAVNGVSELLQVRQFDLEHEAVPAAPLVLANLLAPLLTHWTQKLGQDQASRPKVIVLSGVLVTEADQICGQFAAKNFDEERRLESGEWSASVLRDTDTR